MAKAFVFPGQGSQFVGMGKSLYEENEQARQLFEQANEILGFRITDLMFNGTPEDLVQTKVTQPAVFLCSVIPAIVRGIEPDMVAGHSLGEFSALVASGALSFEDGLKLVSKRAQAMQKCCEKVPGTMAAVLQRNIVVSDEQIEEVCASIDGAVVAANFNCPGQVIISGAVEAVQAAGAKLLEMGVKRVAPLKVGGAFHSPLMEPARAELAEAIESTTFNAPKCPIYQNVDAAAHTDAEEIKQNLVKQLTSPVRWTKSVEAMVAAGATEFIECGPGKVLQGLCSKINKEVAVSSATPEMIPEA